MNKIMQKGMWLFSLAACFTLLSFKTFNDDVKGWKLLGSYPEGYTVGVEKNAARGGNVAYIRSAKAIRGQNFGTLMQEFAADNYQGKRIKLTGYIKSADVKNWAGMWMRIDGEPRSKTLGFDNMNNRAIKGTTEWKQYEIVLDVPEKAVAIAYGVLLTGTGSVWMDDLKIETVSNNTPTTGLGYTTAPQNTSFEESGK